MDLASGRKCGMLLVVLLLSGSWFTESATASPVAKTYYVDCGRSQTPADGSLASPLQRLDQVNALKLDGGDHVLFKRGSVCGGALRMQGSGSEGHPIIAAAYGSGALPRIEAKGQDEAALRLFNQEYWEISSLDISGGTESGVSIGGNSGILHHLYLRDLQVHDVRGKLKQKESGLIVIHSIGPNGSLEDVDLDGIFASDTTQWAGIFISGASREKPATHVRVRNSMVHDVQGDGIVLFNTRDGLIARSVAWHTGMQHAESIGTPNAIWTWQCTDCVIEDNEAFLTDSPGVDGGGFDIDYGNIRNTVRNNFAHDTQGYCVSVFGAHEVTTASVVAGNLCLNNGLSPRLAQRQGAILLMTWAGGSIDGVEIRKNRIGWQPGGDTAAIQAGADLRARGIILSENEIWSNGTTFVASALAYHGEKNHYLFRDADAETIATMRRRFELLPEINSTLAVAGPDDERVQTTRTSQARGCRLVASVPNKMLGSGGHPELRGTLIELKSAALQFGQAGLQVVVATDGETSELASVWLAGNDGIEMVHSSASTNQDLSLQLISPAGTIVEEWKGYAGPVGVGSALRRVCGQPAYGRLLFETVPATD